MEKTLKLANDIMETANSYTNWGFSVKQAEDAYLVGTEITHETGQGLRVVFKVKSDIIYLFMVCDGCNFDGDYAFKLMKDLPFPLNAEGVSGEKLELISSIQLELMEDNCLAVIKERIDAMLDSVTKIINQQKK